MPLRDNLVAHWALEEASGSRADDIGGNSLTDNNTVTGNPGKVSNAAQFTAANSEYLSIADNAALSMGDIDFAFAAWVYLDSTGTATHVVAKWNDTGNQRGYMLQYTGALFRFWVSSTGSDFPNVSASSFGAPSASTWYFVICEHDSVANTISIQVNNGTINSAAHTVGVFDNTAPFFLGAQPSGAGATQYWNGRIDEVGIWKRTLTTAERTALYNSGNGLAFSSFPNTVTLSGSATPAAATGTGVGLVNTNPVYSLSGSATPAAATGTGTGLVNTKPVYSLSGTATPQPATGSGVGLVNTNPVYSLSGSATAGAAVGSGIGLLFIAAPTHFVALTLAARSTALTLAGRP